MESFDDFHRDDQFRVENLDPPSPQRPKASAQETSPIAIRGEDGESYKGTTNGSSIVTSTISEHKSSEISPVYPHLTHQPPESPRDNVQDKETEDDDDGLEMSKSFDSRASPLAALKHGKAAFVSRAGEEGAVRMHKFALHETQNFYYIVGSDLLEESFRILKIDRTADPGELNIIEDDIIYTKRETYQILNAIDEGNRATGGLKSKMSFWGLLGFIRFTGVYYMVYVSKRSQVAMIGGHYIYQIDKTEMTALMTTAAARSRTEKHLEESRFVSIFGDLDLTRGFYFSPSYDVTRTLQHNIMREREALQQGLPQPANADHNDMFVWNHHLLEPAMKCLKKPFDWCHAIFHGYVDQAALSIYWGRVVYVTIIARRSRFFAGARFLKRGANDLGYVANDVETEQIVSEMLTTSFHAPGPQLFANPKYTSHVQHRGSIPLHWMQDSTGVSPKPDIHLNVVDPFFSAAALHFDNLFMRYGTPIYVLNLIKSRERIPRESKLLKEYTLAVRYLNQFLPRDKQILYHAWDMSRASKSRDQDVIGSLEAIAEDILPKTGFFQNGTDEASGLGLQNGVARTNCIDCLDRTNAAQFVIAKKALGYQLQALGVIEEPSVEYDSDAVNLFTHMWHDHGDTIAIQYGGSHLVNTMSTYRKINQWTSHSRDMVESFKRFYNNSFMDAQRQEAYNLFLGNYVFVQGQPMLWDLSTDYYLHHTNPRSMFGKRRPNYTQWYTPAYLQAPSIPPSIWPRELDEQSLRFFDDYWSEYYRPLALSSFRKIYSYRMHSNLRYIPISATQGGKYDLSPFKVRTGGDEGTESGEKTTNQRRKGVKVIAPSEEKALSLSKDSSIDARLAAVVHPDKPPKPQALGNWLDSQQQMYGPNRKYTGIIKDSSWEKASRTPLVPEMPTAATNALAATQQPTKQELALQAFTQMVAKSLSPTVPETEEYQRYVAHPSNIPLVVSSEIDYAKAPAEFLEYLLRTEDYSTQKSSQLRHVDDERGAVSSTLEERAEMSLEDYHEYIDSGIQEEPLTVLEAETELKRYKAYRQWLRGKSLFKQRFVVAGEVV